MEWTTQYGLGTMDYTLWTTQCSTHYCLSVIHYALFSLHYTICLMRCTVSSSGGGNLWWKPPQPWSCQTKPTSWVKHTGKRQRSKMDTKQKNQLSICQKRIWCFFTLDQGSRHVRKVQFFLTLSKRPLAPPPLSFEHYVVNFSEGILTKVRKRLSRRLSTK